MLVSLVGPCYVCLGHERLATKENPPNDFLRSFDNNEDKDDKELESTGRHDPRGRLALVFFVARLVVCGFSLGSDHVPVECGLWLVFFFSGV